MDLEAPAVKRRKIDTDHCIICFKPLNSKKEEVVKNPTYNGLSAILKASQLRKDDVYEALLPLQQDILSLDLKVAFHKSCRAKYTSKSNISTSQASESEKQPCTSAATEHTKLSRNETADFDIRTNCFICGKPNSPRNKLTPICTGTGQSTREKVLAAADKRQDNKIHMRMLAFPDLFAYDAKYHRSCYSHYISERNIAAATHRSQMSTLHDEAFDELKNQLQLTVFSKAKTVTTLAQLKSEFVGYLVAAGATNAEQYTAWKLKERLTKYYGDQIVCVRFDGRTDIICSSSVTLGDALRKATDLQNTTETRCQSGTGPDTRTGSCTTVPLQQRWDNAKNKQS